MLIPTSRQTLQPLSPKRWLILGSLDVVAVTLAALQYTPVALLPAAKTDTILGVAVGCTVMTLFSYVWHRRHGVQVPR